MNDSAIDFLALGGKIAVERSSLNFLSKESVKVGIDFVVDEIKRAQTLQQNGFSVMGLSLGDINTVKSAAQTYALDLVVLFPFPVNGVVVPCFRLKGGDPLAFCKAMGLSFFEPDEVNMREAEQAKLADQYGVIVYIRKE